MGKLVWHIVTNDKKIWVQVLKDKYIKFGDFQSAKVPSNASWRWRSIVKGRNVIERGAAWRVGDGKSLNLWTNWWIGHQPLGLDVETNILDDMLQIKVSDFVLDNQSWNIIKLQGSVTKDIVEKIRAIPIPQEGGTEHKICWHSTTSGKYSVTSVYNLIARTGEGEGEDAWVWKIAYMQKHKMFLWLVVKDKLLTNLEGTRRNLMHDASCQRCGEKEEEYADHLFRGCSFTKEC